MTVVILSMAALLVVGLIAAFASRWKDKSPSEDEDPDQMRSGAERRSVAATTSAMAAMRHKHGKDHH